jgi:hypothetical protein
MRNALTFLLIAMLAWLGPVSGTEAHAHEVGAEHHHTDVAADHDHEDAHHHRGSDREIDLAKMRKVADVDADESGDVILHAHVHMDGAPMSAVMGLHPIHTAGPARSLSNSAPEPDPGLDGLRRPPRPIL